MDDGASRRLARAFVNLRHVALFISFIVRGRTWKFGSELHALDRGSTAQPIGRFCRAINSIHGLLGRSLQVLAGNLNATVSNEFISTPCAGESMGLRMSVRPYPDPILSPWRAENSSGVRPPTPSSTQLCNRFMNDGDDRLMTTLELHVTLLIIHRRNRCTKYLLAYPVTSASDSEISVCLRSVRFQSSTIFLFLKPSDSNTTLFPVFLLPETVLFLVARGDRHTQPYPRFPSSSRFLMSAFSVPLRLGFTA